MLREQYAGASPTLGRAAQLPFIAAPCPLCGGAVHDPMQSKDQATSVHGLVDALIAELQAQPNGGIRSYTDRRTKQIVKAGFMVGVVGLAAMNEAMEPIAARSLGPAGEVLAASDPDEYARKLQEKIASRTETKPKGNPAGPVRGAAGDLWIDDLIRLLPRDLRVQGTPQAALQIHAAQGRGREWITGSPRLGSRTGPPGRRSREFAESRPRSADRFRRRAPGERWHRPSS